MRCVGHAQEGWEVGRDGQPVLEERPRQAWSGQVRVATADVAGSQFSAQVPGSGHCVSHRTTGESTRK